MIKIELSEDDVRIINRTLLEIFGGYAGDFLPEFLGAKEEKLKQIFEATKAVCDNKQTTLAFPKEDWRLIYEAINAVVYELGPEELQTITGHEWNEFLNAGRHIYSKLYNRKGTQEW